MKIFISHASADAETVLPLRDVIMARMPGADLVFSSAAETGTRGGDELLPWINEQLRDCDLFCAVITENYLRRMYCLYEFNVATYLYGQKAIGRLIPICASPAVYGKIQDMVAGQGLIYIDASARDAAQKVAKTFQWDAVDLEGVQTAMARIAATDSSLPYIGCTQEEYGRYMRYCNEQGIRRMQDQPLPPDVVRDHLLPAEEIIVLATTGIGSIRTLRETVFVDALVRGVNIHVITANQWSDFCADVAAVEDQEHGGSLREKPLADEFMTVLGYLQEAYAQARNRVGGPPPGVIRCHSAYTLLRQTVTLGRAGDGQAWCWLSITLPPKRTTSSTPSLELEGNVRDERSFIASVYNHCRAVIDVSEARGGSFTVDDTFKQRPYYFENRHAREYWDRKYAQAQEHMRERAEDYPDCLLIEVAAQHPLLRGEKPGREFEGRLKLAIRLYEEYTEQGSEVKLYVPGSRHQYRGKADRVSLSAAGKQYLVAHGVPAEDIYADEMNDRYKGADGVYNSADECYVASRIFEDGEFGSLLCICSPNQVARKTLFYYEFGIVPQCWSAPADRMYHNILDELFGAVSVVLKEDHDWQDPNGQPFRESREERRP